MGGVNSSIIAKDSEIPLADNSVDKILLIHYFEYASHPNLLLREIWRLLKPGGKLLLVAPNKLSLWPHSKKYPYKKCKLFSIMQLSKILDEAMLSPVKTSSTLFALSNAYRFFPDVSDAIENWSSKWLSPFGGVLLVEAEKLICAVPTSQNFIKPKKFIFNLGS
jgi:ubiquinone/menaquinone biosynthesis C-methylase UbiE